MTQIPIPTSPQSSIQMPELPSVNTVAMPQQGGQGGIGAGGFGAISSGISGIVGALSPQEKINQEFMSRNENVMNSLNRADSLTDASAGIASAFGPVGMAIGAGLKVGNQLQKSSLGEFGEIKDPLKFAASFTANPISGISTLLAQKDVNTAKERFTNTKVASATSQNQEMGNVINNSLPQYKAPSYGRQGLKLISKFSK